MLMRLLCIGLIALNVWALFYHAPMQREFGRQAAFIEADKITKEASDALFNDAENATVAFDLCFRTGGLYDFTSGTCERKSAD